MAKLRLPPSHKEIAGRLAKEVDDSTFSALTESLENLPPTLSHQDLATAVRTSVPSLDEEDASSLLTFLVSAHWTRFARKWSAERVAARIASSLELTEPEIEVLESRLTRLLALSDLSDISKAMDVLTDHERVFVDSRIITDVRPVFGNDATANPEVSVLVHMLKIAYQDSDGRSKAVHVALDTDDLGNLRRTVDRAMEKTNSLKNFLASLPMPLLDVEGQAEEDE